MREADKASLKPPATSDALGLAKKHGHLRIGPKSRGSSFPKNNMVPSIFIGLFSVLPMSHVPTQFWCGSIGSIGQIHRPRRLGRQFPWPSLWICFQPHPKGCWGPVAQVALRHGLSDSRNTIGLDAGTKFWIWMVLGSYEEGMILLHPIAGHSWGLWGLDSTHDSRQVSMGLTFVALYDHGFVRQHRPRKAPRDATGTVKPTAWQQQKTAKYVSVSVPAKDRKFMF